MRLSDRQIKRLNRSRSPSVDTSSPKFTVQQISRLRAGQSCVLHLGVVFCPLPPTCTQPVPCHTQTHTLAIDALLTRVQDRPLEDERIWHCDYQTTAIFTSCLDDDYDATRFGMIPKRRKKKLQPCFNSLLRSSPFSSRWHSYFFRAISTMWAPSGSL